MIFGVTCFHCSKMALIKDLKLTKLESNTRNVVKFVWNIYFDKWCTHYSGIEMSAAWLYKLYKLLIQIPRGNDIEVELNLFTHPRLMRVILSGTSFFLDTIPQTLYIDTLASHWNFYKISGYITFSGNKFASIWMWASVARVFLFMMSCDALYLRGMPKQWEIIARKVGYTSDT